MARDRGNAGRIPDSKRSEHQLHQRINMTLHPDILARLEKYCDDEERARSWVISKAIDFFLESKGY